MKPLDELRSISDGCAYNEEDCRQWRSCREHRAQLLDTIEREIAERYMELPLDADGVPIHIGDVMEWCDSGETLTVEGIGIDVLFYIDGENAEWTAARNKRHYHAPTVEDVLEDFYRTAKADSDANMGDLYETIAEFADKLRLAGDAE